MTLLSEKDQLPAGFIYNNILALRDGTVIGILLGHCVFGRDGQVAAKYFRHTLFNLQGEILAKNLESNASLSFDKEKLLKEAWQIIELIKDHTCPMIDPTENWSMISLASYFSNEGQ